MLIQQPVPEIWPHIQKSIRVSSSMDMWNTAEPSGKTAHTVAGHLGHVCSKAKAPQPGTLQSCEEVQWQNNTHIVAGHLGHICCAQQQGSAAQHGTPCTAELWRPVAKFCHWASKLRGVQWNGANCRWSVSHSSSGHVFGKGLMHDDAELTYGECKNMWYFAIPSGPFAISNVFTSQFTHFDQATPNTCWRWGVICCKGETLGDLINYTRDRVKDCDFFNTLKSYDIWVAFVY